VGIREVIEKRSLEEDQYYFCHSHESGNPGVKDNKRKIDSPLRGNDIMEIWNDIMRSGNA
jgi:hypothetical protein